MRENHTTWVRVYNDISNPNLTMVLLFLHQLVLKLTFPTSIGMRHRCRPRHSQTATP